MSQAETPTILNPAGLGVSLAEYPHYDEVMPTHEPPHTSELVAENVRALMARTKAKQADLANALGMTQGAVSKKVNGDRPFTLDEIDHDQNITREHRPFRHTTDLRVTGIAA